MAELRKPESAHPGGQFVFISYSHIDSETVYRDIRALQGRGIRVWYDEGLELGEQWFRDVEDKLNLPACIGVIFYVSESFLASKAVQKEIRLFSESQKAHYFAVNLLNAPIPDKVLETPGLEPPIRDTLLKLFNNDITYLTDSETRKYEKMESCVFGWGYDPTAEFFPCGNVLHRGHVEYLPTLLDLTPLNYTFFIMSNHLRWIAETLDQVCILRKGWSEMRAMDFVNAGIQSFQGCRGLVVIFAEREIRLLQEVLKLRSRLWRKLPLLAVFYTETLSEEFNARALSEFRQWHEASCGRPAALRAEEYLLIQTGRDTEERRRSSSELDNMDITERWRTLISDGCYHKTAVERFSRNNTESACGRWLMFQEPLQITGNTEDQTMAVCPDLGVLELCSRDRFRR